MVTVDVIDTLGMIYGSTGRTRRSATVTLMPAPDVSKTLTRIDLESCKSLTLDFRFLQGMHALDTHLLLEDLASGTT